MQKVSTFEMKKLLLNRKNHQKNITHARKKQIETAQR